MSALAEGKRAHGLSPWRQAYEMEMQARMTRTPRQPEVSVELTLNAKGDVQVNVSVQGIGEDVAGVGAKAEAEFDRLLAKYPRAVRDPEDELAQARKAAKIQAARARAASK